MYITNLQQALNKGQGDLPGLYKARHAREWSATKSDDTKITTVVGAIGAVIDKDAYAYNVSITAQEMGEFFERHTSGDHLQDTFSLYYTPEYIVDELGAWRTPEQKISREGAGSEQLAQVLMDTQKQYWAGVDEPEHHWYVWEDGAKLLTRVLDLIPNNGGTTLNSHRFQFINPKANVGALLHKLQTLRAATDRANKALMIAANHQPAQLHQALGGNDLVTGMQSHRLPAQGWDKKLQPGSQFLQGDNKKLMQALDQGKINSLNFQELYRKTTESLGSW